MTDGEKMSPMVVLRRFFGMREGQTLRDFMEEMRQLSPAEHLEMVTLAAQALGVEVEWGPKK